MVKPSNLGIEDDLSFRTLSLPLSPPLLSPLSPKAEQHTTHEPAKGRRFLRSR